MKKKIRNISIFILDLNLQEFQKIAVFFILLFLASVQNKWLFVLIVLISTLLADIDSEHSFVGRYLVFKPIQFLARHRGVFHSLTFLILVIASSSLL